MALPRFLQTRESRLESKGALRHDPRASAHRLHQLNDPAVSRVHRLSIRLLSPPLLPYHPDLADLEHKTQEEPRQEQEVHGTATTPRHRPAPAAYLSTTQVLPDQELGL